MNRSLADQMVWDFEDNRSDVAMVEEVLAMAQERIAVIPVFLVEGILKIVECVSVDGEHIGSDSDEGANTRLAMDFARIAFYQDLRGHLKSGQWWSLQNRRTECGLGLGCFTPTPRVEASLFSCANSVDRI